MQKTSFMKSQILGYATNKTDGALNIIMIVKFVSENKETILSTAKMVGTFFMVMKVMIGFMVVQIATNLYGDEGNDTLTGGTGNDRFVFRSELPFDRSTNGTDTITDFKVAEEDRILLDLNTFTALSSRTGDGFSNPQDFAVVSRDGLVANSQALIVYSSGSGNLFYNENGSEVGLGDGGQFAKLNNAPDLIAESFEITYR